MGKKLHAKSFESRLEAYSILEERGKKTQTRPQGLSPGKEPFFLVRTIIFKWQQGHIR